MTRLDAATHLMLGFIAMGIFVVLFAGAGCAIVWYLQNWIDRRRARRAAR